MHLRCEIDLLGKLQIRQGERTIGRFRTYKTGVLLAYLAFYPDRPHPREEIIELLWPGCEPAQGRNSLSQSLSSLRNQLEPPGVPIGAVLIADRFTVRLNPDAFTTDVAAFEAAIKAYDRTDLDRQGGANRSGLSMLLDAVQCFGGELLPGCYEDWILRERERLTAAYLQALDRLIAHFEQAGDPKRAIEFARRAIEADPLREQSHADLIRICAGAGQTAAALRQYQEMKRLLEQELGISPAPEIQALVQNLALAPRPSLPKTASSTSATPTSLPTGIITLLLIEAGANPEVHSFLKERVCRSHDLELQLTDDIIGVVFGRASDALACAVALSLALSKVELSNDSKAMPPRMALHTGEVTESNRAALPAANPISTHALMLLVAAHAGQILCSEEAAVLLKRDLEPELKLTDLGLYRLRGAAGSERLFTLEYPGQPQAAFPLPDAEPGYTSNVPLQFTRFFGREAESARLVDLLSPSPLLPFSPSRLITLTGPGGTGKTRLSCEVARQMLDAYQGAVWFVPLADLSEADLIPKAILNALHLPGSAHLTPMQQIVAALSRQPTLMILDNFEQLLGTNTIAGNESVRIVQSLLNQLPDLICLVTSRRVLGLAGEQEIALAPLPTPMETGTPEQLSLFESVQLFADRAQMVRPDFQVTNGNAEAVAALCRRLEGIPLALELAAARAQILTPAQILARLEHRLDFLVSRRADREARHQTLRAAIDWSYTLLPEALQRLFACLSVFRGGWSLEAAEFVCSEDEGVRGQRSGGSGELLPTSASEAHNELQHGRWQLNSLTPDPRPLTPDVLDCLAQLRECSLIIAHEQGGEAGEMRFQMLETLREYAEQKLTGEEKIALRWQHAAFFLDLAEQAEQELVGPLHATWLARLDVDHDNLRAALNWFVDNRETRLALRLGGALGMFWGIRGHVSEARERLTRALALAEDSDRTAQWAKVGNLAGKLALNQGDFAAARALHEQSLAVYRQLGDKQGAADTLRYLGNVAYEQGDSGCACALLAESLALFREIGEARHIGGALTDLGKALTQHGEYAAARPLFEEGLALYRRLEHRVGIALTLLYFGASLQEQGDPAAALPVGAESLTIFRESGNQGGVANALLMLGHTLCDRGEYASARQHAQESLAIFREMGDKDGIGDALYCLGRTAFCLDDYAEASACLEQSLSLFEELGSKVSISRGLEALASLAMARGQMERAALLSASADRLREAIHSVRPPSEPIYFERNVETTSEVPGEPVVAVVADRAQSLSRE